MLRLFGLFFVAGAWYILYLCNALWKWTYAFSATFVFSVSSVSILGAFIGLEFVSKLQATKRLRRIRRFLKPENFSRAKLSACQLHWPLLSRTQDFFFAAQVICIFVRSAQQDRPDLAVFEAAASTSYLLIYLTLSSWEDLAFRRAWRVGNAGAAKNNAEKMEWPA